MRFVIKKWADVLRITSGKTQKGVLDPNGAYPIYGSGGIMGYANQYLCEAGTTIVGRKGTIDNPIFVNERFWNVDTAFGISPGEQLNSRYLYFFCRHFNFRQLDKSTTIPSLAKTDLLSIEIPVPPLSEQKRIVARIEELFSELDNGVETLKKTKQQLAVYRQSVLKAAFEGALECSEKTMSIDDLLVTDRKGMTTGPFGTLIKKHEHQHEGVPMLGIENIGEGKFIDGNKIFVTAEKALELKAFSLKAGDIIISRSGTVGEICSVPARMEGALLSTNLIRVSLNPEKVLPAFFIYMFLSKGVVLDQVKELCKGSTRLFLNQTILRQIHFPIPNLKKQSQIIGEIESKMSVCDGIEKSVDSALQQAESMRQSILKKAFEGALGKKEETPCH